METISYLSIIVFLLILHVLTNRSLHKLQNRPPTPFPTIPFTGHLYLLKRKKNVPLHIALCEVSRKYGPVLYLRFGIRPVVLVSSTSGAEECFTKNDITFANRPTLLVGKLLNYNSTTLVWSSYGQHWRNLRQIATLEILSSNTIHRLSPIRVDEVRALILSLFQEFSDHEKQLERIVKIRPALYELGMSVMRSGKRHYYGESSEENSDFAKQFRGIVAEFQRRL
ncbi:cytochrome P450 81Q32-like [Coffea arabica]|uniref:Cytochrome P450 81Q32-like n=1 Tax=Coffea arabica TaxID=13443 RepID=A0A6P6W2K6_COFAR|nr:isoflavone 3'-hydroxylase-like [Coffea arabica]